MAPKIKIEVSPAERTMIIAALRAYDDLTLPLASRIALSPVCDPTDDGHEVAILRTARNDQ